MSDQTPRVPELWWSPEGCSVYVDREGAAPHYIRMQDTALHALPADAVRLGDVEALRAELNRLSIGVQPGHDHCRACHEPYKPCPTVRDITAAIGASQ